MEISEGIIVDKNIRFGRPVIKGTRVPVALILGKLSGGMSYKEIMYEYDLTEDNILAALKYAAWVVSEEEIWVAA